MDMGKEFDPALTSKKMGQETMAVLHWPMTVSSWRHSIIAFKHRLCKGAIDAHLEEEVMSALHAQQSGHSVATETRIYGINQDSFGGVSQDLIQLYLDATSEYHKAFKIPLGGHGFHYQTCLMPSFDTLFPAANTPSKATPPADTTALMTLLKSMADASAKQYSTLLSKISSLEKTVLQLEQNKQAFGPPPSVSQLHAPLRSAQTIKPSVPVLPPPFPVSASQNQLHAPAQTITSSISVQPPPSPPSASQIQLHAPPARSPHTLPSASMVRPSAPPRDSQETATKLQSTDITSLKPAKSVLYHLRQLYGPKAQWRIPEQRQAVDALLDLDCDVIVALRTGIGKTAIAILPSMVEDAITVLVLPLIALMDDWKRRLAGLNIAFEQFKGAADPHLSGNTNIILVSSDMARNRPFKKALQVVAARRTVARFVLDECHYYFTDADFRTAAMQDPWQLRTDHSCQFVFLSGTLPPSARLFLQEQFMCKQVKVITCDSARPELAFMTFEQKSLKDTLEELEDDIDSCRAALDWELVDRYMVFVSTIDLGNTISKMLDLDFYRANSKQFPVTEQDRLAMMGRFLSGEKQGLVCTTALGAGNDYPAVRLTIHVGTPSDATMFVQQSGRAGRDEKWAWCIIRPMGLAITGSNSQFSEMRGVKPMNQMVCKGALVWPQTCDRFILGNHLDGDGKHCFEYSTQYALCLKCQQGDFFFFFIS